MTADKKAKISPTHKRLRQPMVLTPGKRVRYFFETAAAYLFFGFFRILPVAWASATGGFLLSVIGPRMGISNVARRNLAQAFPEKTEAEREVIVRGMWDNLGRVIAEYPHLRSMASRIELEGTEYFDLARKEGGIFFSGHIANWEIYGPMALKHDVRLNLLYRKPNNPWVDGLLRYARGGDTVGHVAKSERGAREMLSLLKQKSALAILMDQKLTGGVSVPFFGRDAQTASALALFALKFDCPIIPGVAERLPGARFRVRLYPPLTITKTGDQEADVRRILLEVNGWLEQWIRARPAEWLWLHKRWPN